MKTALGHAGATATLLLAMGKVALPAPADATTEAPPDLVFRASDQGLISSWLVLGPERKGQIPSDFVSRLSGEPRRGGYAPGGHWSVAHGKSGVLELKGTRPAIAYLAAVLRSREPRRLWLSLGSDGPLEVWVNGRRALARTCVRKGTWDTDLVPLDLTAGDTVLLLKLESPRPSRWRIFARLLDDNFSPAEDVWIVLPRAGARAEKAIRQMGKLVLDRHLDHSTAEVKVRVLLRFEGGAPVVPPFKYTIRCRGAESGEPISSLLKIPAEGSTTVVLGELSFEKPKGPVGLDVYLGNDIYQSRLGFQMTHVQRVATAQRFLDEGLKHKGLPKSSIDSVAWRVDHLTGLIEAGDEDYRYLERETRRTERFARDLAEGKDPYAQRRGEIQRRGYRSRLDGKLHHYALYVPYGWREEGEERFGLVIALHGLGGSPMKALQDVFGESRGTPATQRSRERYPKRVKPVRFFVLAPTGFGRTFYREHGEVDVLDALAAVTGRYRIDPARVYITGTSMGGTGAGALSLHKPDLFAAAAPLAGYHSLFVREWFRSVHLRPFEAFLAGHLSNSYWAENGRHLPLYVVHGLKDGPRHSKALVDRYKALGYEVEYETPNLGHNVWDATYKNRSIFKRFSRIERVVRPKRVTFKTARRRFNKAYWIRIDDVEDDGAWSNVDASFEQAEDVRIRTENVSAFSLLPSAPSWEAGVSSFLIDGQLVELGEVSTEEVSFWKEGDLWQTGPAAPCEGICKRPGLSGPIRDIFYEPLMLVYGTARPGEAFLTKRLAEEIRLPRKGVTVDWPVKADVEVTDRDIAERSLVVIGTPKGNALLGRIAHRLPLRIREDGIEVDGETYEGDKVAAAFIYPNPLNPKRYVVVLSGTTPAAVFYTAHLPELLPDYVVYDASSWCRKGGLAFNERPILRAGFFDKHWRFKKPYPTGRN